MTKSKILRQAMQTEVIVTYIADFAFAFLLCRASVFGTEIPLGVAYALAKSKNGTSIYPILGAFLGYIFMPNSAIGFLYAGILLVSVALFNLVKTSRFTILGATYFALSLVSFVSKGINVTSFVTFIATNIICITSFYIYTNVYDEKFEEIAKLFLLCTITMATIDIEIFSLSPARIFLVSVLLCVIYYIDASKSVIVAVLFGATCDILLKTQIYTLGYSFGALIASASKFLSKIYFSLLFALIFTIFTGFNQGFQIISIIEVLIASVVFVLLPKKSFKYFAKKRRVIQVKKMTTTGILHDISELLIDTERKKADIEFSDMKNIFEMTENKVCKGCSKVASCYGTHHRSISDEMNLVAMRVTQSECATFEDFPREFSNRCINFNTFLNTLNHGLTLAIQKNKTKSELLEQKQMMARQYKALADVLQNSEITFKEHYYPEYDKEIFEFLKKYRVLTKVTTYINSSGLFFVELVVLNATRLYEKRDEIAVNIGIILGKTVYFNSQIIENNYTKLVFKQKVPFIAKTTVKTMSKDKVSGDVSSFFSTKEDMFYAIISDGMGSGKIANAESASLAKLLIKLLKTGSTPLKATKVIEPLSMLKSDSETFVALDLVAVNLITLETQFVKYGAFTSFILRKNDILKISSSNLALGLNSEAEMKRIRLEPEDKIILLSDGFSLSIDEIEDILLSNPTDICEEIFLHDKTKNDDKTALVIELNNM